MKQLLQKFIKNQHGNALVLVTLAMMGLLSMIGVVIDGGNLYLTKSALQKTANAAALSGAQELTENLPGVTGIVHEVLAKHGEEGSLDEIQVTMNDTVRVKLKKDVPLHFAGLLGMDKVNVSVQSAAEIGTMGRAAGAAPLGINENVNLEYGREYGLKVDQHDVEYGNFGVLALGGTGADTYEENLRNGYENEIEVGDVLITQTGNISGKTRTVIEEKILKCPIVEGQEVDRDCERIILIPVYQEHNRTVNQLKEVKITGFAYFLITAPMDARDTSISGIFLKRTGTGFIDDGIENNGAYAIRLTE